ncbi:MAG: hypothetical protein E6J91_27130 [Deltaproteobacteria bacterium]|nr:MAG: hypothetical protein E6J91_27130 [Deltaproteobacteria bacterium]
MITPCASVQATASKGIGDVLLDPRTSFVECLETILVAELADQESWAALVRAAEALGESSLTQKITRAQQTEVEHLTKVRGWLEAADQARTKVARSTR